MVRGTIHQNVTPLKWVSVKAVNTGGFEFAMVPNTGKRLRIHYLSYGSDVAPCEIYFLFDDGVGTHYILKNNLVVAGSIIAKDFGDFHALEGGVNEGLIIFYSAGLPYYTCFYTEF